MLLWSGDTGTDLMVTYQRAPPLSPSYLVGPHLALYNPRQGTACCAQLNTGQSYSKLHTVHDRLEVTLGQRFQKLRCIQDKWIIVWKERRHHQTQTYVHGCLMAGWEGKESVAGMCELAGV